MRTSRRPSISGYQSGRSAIVMVVQTCPIGDWLLLAWCPVSPVEGQGCTALSPDGDLMQL